MSEHQRRERATKAFLAERDEVLRNPTFENATTFWKKQNFPPPVEPDVPLATIHKARLHWLDATDAMLRESVEWLRANGYDEHIHGVIPPLTPETRDAQRVERGFLPLRDH
jgi:hypothetical protein